MICRNTKFTCDIDVDVHGTVTESEFGGRKELDVTVECPKCHVRHYTFIPTGDLTVDDEP